MRKEPEIVKILRDEERSGVLYTKLNGSCEDLQNVEDVSVDTSHDTIMMVQQHNDTQQLHMIDPSFLEMIYRTVFETSAFAIFVVDEKGRIIVANHNTEAILGKTSQQILLSPVTSIYPPDEWRRIESHFKQQHEPNHFFETKIVTRSNRLKDVAICLSALKDDQGKNLGLIHFIKTISEKKQDGPRINSIIEYADDSVYLLDKNSRYLMVNNELLSRLGCSREEVLGKTFSDFHSLKETKEFIQKLDWVFEHGRPLKDEHCRKRNWFLRTLSPVKDSISAQTTAVLVVSKDITDTKKAVMALGESEKKFRKVLENSLDMIYQLNLKKQTYDYISPSSVKVLGYVPEEMTSFTFKKIEELIYPDDRAQWHQHLTMITNYRKRRDVVQAIEYRIKHKALGYRWISDTCSAVFNEKHEASAIVGTVEDITDRKKVWDEIVKSEEKYRILAETSADGVFTTDALGRLTYVNPSFEKLCGRRKSQILATPFRKYLLEDSIYFFQQIFIDVRKKNEKIENVELELVLADGSITPIEVNIAPLKKETEFNGVVCTVRDITQRRDIEDELKKNERLKTEFMNIAAHELRSPVTPIKGYLDLIIHDNESNEKIKNWAKISLRNAERLLKLVNDILDVARLDSDTMRFEMEKIDPVDLLKEIAEDMGPAITNKKLEFQINIPTTLPHIVGDKNRLSQVLKNLIGNALKFTDSGFIALSAEKKENHILISVADSGIGISQDELKKIFSKFYQAYTGEDRNNEGTGLGLFISKEIIKKHNGAIWAESQIGKGSQFVIQLPFVYKMTVDFQT